MRQSGTQRLSKTWHGADKNKYQWYPKIDYSKCTGCGLCLLSCGNDVFRWTDKNLPVVANPGNCVMGCTTCAKVCPENTIAFPEDPRLFIRNVIIKEKVFFTVKRELKDRLEKYPDHRVSVEDVVDTGKTNRAMGGMKRCLRVKKPDPISQIGMGSTERLLTGIPRSMKTNASGAVYAL